MPAETRDYGLQLMILVLDIRLCPTFNYPITALKIDQAFIRDMLKTQAA